MSPIFFCHRLITCVGMDVLAWDSWVSHFQYSASRNGICLEKMLEKKISKLCDQTGKRKLLKIFMYAVFVLILGKVLQCELFRNFNFYEFPKEPVLPPIPLIPLPPRQLADSDRRPYMYTKQLTDFPGAHES